MKTFSLAVVLTFLLVSAADAKCVLGQRSARVIDGLTRSECFKLNGAWVDARQWSRPSRRIARPD